MMKHEWRKKEKKLYLPKTKPEMIKVPKFKYFMIKGKGNPNNEFFGEYIGVLYSRAYGVRMSHKAGFAPKEYFEYTVYPLEGIWDISEKAKQNDSGILDKDTLIFNLMIRQPDFVTNDFAQKIIERTKKKKPHELLEEVSFGSIEDGLSVQMMHLGSYDNEPESFKKMDAFCSENKFIRVSKRHRELYLSDVRKVKPDKLKTVLRYKIKE